MVKLPEKDQEAVLLGRERAGVAGCEQVDHEGVQARLGAHRSHGADREDQETLAAAYSPGRHVLIEQQAELSPTTVRQTTELQLKLNQSAAGEQRAATG